MAITAPTGEQLRFVSAKTGEHVLDTYLEAAEIGNRQLSDLLDDMFDTSTGVFRSDNFQFRFDTTTDKIQVRVGQFANSNTSWTDVTTFFKITGAFNSSTTYNNFDLLTLTNKDVYIVHGLTSGTTFADEAAVIASSNTDKIVDVSEAKDWAIKTDGIVSSTDYSSKAWAIGGTGVTNSSTGGAAKEWATKTGGTVDGTNYSAKYWATHPDVTAVSGNISHIQTVSGISSNVSTVAGVSSSVTALAATDVLADMALLATTDVIADMNTLAVADVISDMNTLGTADVVNDMNVLGTSTNVTNMNTLAGISSDITAVAGKASLITSDFVSDLNQVAVTDVINDINLLATSDIVADLNTLATTDIVSDLNTLATTDIVADINLLATNDIVADLNQLATSDFVSDLNTMATTANVSALNTVSGSIANVNTVGTDLSSGSSKISTVATDISNVNTNATNISNINSLASVLTGSTTYTITVANVSGQNVFVIDGVNNPTLALVRGNTYVFDLSDSSNSGHPLAFKDGSGNAYTSGVTSSGTAGSSGATVTFAVPSDAPSSLRYYCTAHGNAMGNTITASSNNLSVVAGSISNVNNVGGSITNVNTVSGSIANVNTVATNINSVNDFADKYRIGSSDPTSNNDEGDLFYNTTSNILKVWTGSAWEGGVTAGSGFLALTGGQLTGNLTFSGTQTVDGRDLSVDGAKLDGIEANATADQTAAEIRTLVESATDSNVFTDADHTKLNGIESGATADQTAAEIRALVESATDSNVFTDADHTKLNAIEANATADQTKSDIDALNINADTVDSLHASSFLRSDAADSASGTITVATGTDPAIIAKSDEWGEQLEVIRNHASFWPSVKFSNTSGEKGKVFVDTSNNNLMYAKGSTSNYETVWTSLTDGSGSGLDADTLDGVQGSSYLRSDADDTATGNLTFNGTIDFANDVYIGWGGGTNRPAIQGNKTNGTIEMFVGGAERAQIDSNYTTFFTHVAVEDHALQVGDISNDNYLELGQDYADGRGFTYQHDNASVMKNLQGTMTQYLVLGDSDTSSSETLFGVSIYYNSAYYPRFKVAGNGAVNMYGNLDVDGNVTADNIYMANRMYHEGDTDTYFQFNNNGMVFVAGGGQEMSIGTSGVFLTNSALNEDYDALSGTTPTCNVTSGGMFSLTMTGNTTFTFSGAISGYLVGFILELTGNGGTVDFTTNQTVKFAGGTAPDAPASGETDIYVFQTRDGGTTWYGALAVDAAA